MAVYKPKYRDPKTGELVKSNIWWYEFSLAGKRIRESAQTPLKSIAREAEQDRRRELEKTLAGMPIEKRENRINSVADLVKTYLERYELDHRGRQKSILFAKGRLAHVTRLLGSARLPDVTEDAVRRYIKTRIAEKVSGRTINMEVGEFSRAIGKPWSFLWPKVRKQEERKDIGRALSPEEETRLLESAGKKGRWHTAAIIVRALLLTGMRSGELTGAAWGQVDFERRVLNPNEQRSFRTALRSRGLVHGEVWGDAPRVLPVPVRLSAQRSHAPHYNTQDGLGQHPEGCRGIMPPARLEAYSDHQTSRGGRSREHHAFAGGTHEPGHAGAVQSYPHGGETGSG